MAPEANPGKRPRIATQQTAALTETSPSRGSTTSSTSSLSEEQLEQRLLLKMASMTSKGETQDLFHLPFWSFNSLWSIVKINQVWLTPEQVEAIKISRRTL